MTITIAGVGLQGPGGADVPLAIPYTFSTTTTDADPSLGHLRLSSATQNASTVIRADLTDNLGGVWTTILDTLDDSTSTIKGHIRLSGATDKSKWIIFTLTSIATPSGYRNLTVVPVASSATSPFANGDLVVLSFSRTGDLGTAGATGATGATGSTGSTGSAGAAGLSPMIMSLDYGCFVESSSTWAWSLPSPYAAATPVLYGGYTLSGTGASAEQLDFKVPLAAGTWSFNLYYLRGVNTGNVQVIVDGTTSSSFDTYNAGGYIAGYSTFTSVVATTGQKTVSIKKVGTKNGSSSDYVVAFSALRGRTL